jgi:hypothetical protein
MNPTNFETAYAVLEDVESEYGKAVAAVLLSSAGLSPTPLSEAKAEMAVKGRALAEAAKFAAKNQQP